MRAELLAAGNTRNEIEHRLRTGALIAVFPGVYRVGHRAPSPEARYMAAVKACGEGAVLSGLAAAWAWGLTRGAPPLPEVTSPTERRIKGIRTHRSRRLHPREQTTWKRIPITTVPRTLVDLPSLLSFDELTRAVHEADVRHGTRPEHIEAVLSRAPNAKGATTLRAIADGDHPTLLSKLSGTSAACSWATAWRCRSSTASAVPTTSTAAGRSTGSRSSSTRTAFTARGAPGSRTASASALREPVVTSSRRYTWRDVVEEPAPTVAELMSLL